MKILLLPVTLIALPLYAQQVVYPLHIGDRWQYSVMVYPPDTPSQSVSARITRDTTMPGGKTYAVITWSGYGATYEYERQSGDSVLEYDPAKQREFLMFDFTRRPGDTVASVPRGSDTMDIVLRSYFPGPPRTWWFYVNQYRKFIDDEYSVAVQDSLGIVGKRPDFGDPFSLTGAIIDGHVYGTIDGIAPGAGQTPREPTLEQNFPNPFNPTTTIRYSLPGRSHATLVVWNTLGQKVATLVDGLEEIGYHEVTFDATGLASGVYFYRLQAGATVLSRKLILMR